MSDIEEPPTKVTKMDGTASSLDSTMEGQEGQEEWLSEGVLTDDDYMAANTSQDATLDPNIITEVTQDLQLPQEKLSQENLPQDELSQQNLSQGELSKEEMYHEQVPEDTKLEQNIEDTLNNLEGMEAEIKNYTFGELLTLNKLGKDSENEQSEPHSDDDGHNTDDLLRMLGEDDSKKKKKVLSTLRERKVKREARSSEDEYLFKGAKITTLKMAKKVIRKLPTKAEPEDFSDRDSDMSDNDVSAIKKMFNAKSRPAACAAKSRAVVSVKKGADKPKLTPLKQYSNTKVKTSNSQDKSKLSEFMYKEEFLDDDDEFDMDENEHGEHTSMGSSAEQPIRRPERMDEEVPSDEDSQSEDDSLYDVLPSSDDEDLDNWFNLDIRAERAGDYLPWLGDKAHKLLTEEKHRVSARLEALRQSVSALRKSGRVQADQIKVATDALHELDAMLAAV